MLEIASNRRNAAEQPRDTKFAYEGLEQAFPNADPKLKPYGNYVLVQIRTPRTKSKGGIQLVDEARETDMWNTQVAKIVALGAVAFRNRETLEVWPEGEWAKIGDYARVPKYGGDRWWVNVPDHPDGKALFCLFKDTDLIGQVPEDAVLDMAAYIY
jgi:co-chaperonin GroES (HSP10)